MSDSVPEHRTLEYWRAPLRTLTDEQLVETLSSQRGNRGWTSSRSLFTTALKDELMSRPIDVSAVITESSMSMAHRLKLEDGKIVILPESESE